MASYSEMRRVPLDLIGATRGFSIAIRALDPAVRIEVENEAFGLVVASRPAGTARDGSGERDRGEDQDQRRERFRWELWPLAPRLTEAKLVIETDGVAILSRGRLKETAEWLFA